jgi:hypothetical protein
MYSEAEELYNTYKVLLTDLIVDETKTPYLDGISYYIHTKTGAKYSYDCLNHEWLRED